MRRPRAGPTLEARAQHTGARALTEQRRDDAGAVIGIDLGTTNSALARAEARQPVRLFDVPQLVAPGEIDRRSTLPSFLYITDEAQRDRGAVRLPWDPAPDLVAGVFARDEGSLVPARQIASAKSWLSNARVDRTAALLPWGTESGPRFSPVEASARILSHLRDAWNHEYAREADHARLERQDIVLTVPASFDEEARELTVQAGRAAGFDRLTLLEEPLAAVYAWIAAHRRSLAQTFGAGALILVCDVGGGTTDFSLIRAHTGDADAGLRFERIAIGEHLLLGGDNLDLALAAIVEQKLAQGSRLTLTQRQTLRRKCSAAKEHVLSDGSVEGVALTILGAGRSVVGGGMTVELTRAEVVAALAEGFLPLTAATDLPARDRRVGLRELGLPYETEPAITRHLAAFLARAGRGSGDGTMARPDAVLFNGGFFAPALARQRVLDALAGWFGTAPFVLENERPEAAVAVGAAFYGRLRRDPAASTRLLIRAGSARTYYVGVHSDDAGNTNAVCVLPRGTEEGTRIAIDRELSVMTNQPAAFTLYSATDRHDGAGDVVRFAAADDVLRHAPLVTAFRYGKRSRRVPLRVQLEAAFTETGTLELWCVSAVTGHRWRLAFNLRGVDADPLDDRDADGGEGDVTGVVIGGDATDAAERLLRGAFAADTSAVAPDALVAELETTLGYNRQSWPIATIRRLADVLIDVAAGRRKSPAFEARWLNLAGFCTRPGFGSSSDPWRVSELRKVYAGGLAFPKEIQNQVEWIVLWQRVGAGFSAGQQRELAHKMIGVLGLGQRKPARLNPQIEREAWRLIASLERLDAGQRTRLGDDLLERIRREPRSASWLWGIGRLGARTPLYGPLNGVVPASVAERWIDRLLALKDLTADAAAAIVQIGARTDDPARDVSSEVAHAAAARLAPLGFDAAPLQHAAAAGPLDAGRIFGESLPEGLHLA